MHESMILFIVLSCLSSSDPGPATQDPQDPQDWCPDIAQSILGEGSGSAEAENREDALKASFENALSIVCEEANRLADHFLTHHAQCTNGCEADEIWWEWCDSGTLQVTHQHCSLSGTLWTCNTDLRVSITAYMTCVPQAY